MSNDCLSETPELGLAPRLVVARPVRICPGQILQLCCVWLYAASFFCTWHVRMHSLMSLEHHFDNVVVGGDVTEPSVAGAGQAVPESCSTVRSALATQNAMQQASVRDSSEPHKTTEPAATVEVAAGSSKRAPVTETGPRQDAAQKSSRQEPWMVLPA